MFCDFLALSLSVSSHAVCSRSRRHHRRWIAKRRDPESRCSRHVPDILARLVNVFRVEASSFWSPQGRRYHHCTESRCGVSAFSSPEVTSTEHSQLGQIKTTHPTTPHRVKDLKASKRHIKTPQMVNCRGGTRHPDGRPSRFQGFKRGLTTTMSCRRREIFLAKSFSCQTLVKSQTILAISRN